MPRVAAAPYHVLFLDSTNASRSIMGEAILESLGGGRFRGHSAGSHPSGEVDPMALEVLRANGYGAASVRSKSWSEYIGKAAPSIHFAIVVSRDLLPEHLPALSGRPVIALWDVPDPRLAASPAGESRRAYLATLGTLRRRIQQIFSLPLDSVDRFALRHELDEIGRY